MLLIDSVYINRSGGKRLLEYLIQYIHFNDNLSEYYFLIDRRFELSGLKDFIHFRYEVVAPSESARSFFYKNTTLQFDSVLCFGNVPPPIVIDNRRVAIYFHNVLLVDSSEYAVSFLALVRNLIKWNYIKFRNFRSYTWLVQTSIVKSLLLRKLTLPEERVKIIPFFDITTFGDASLSDRRNFNNYLYVADSSSQKNHLRLLDAWELFTLAHSDYECTLHLTVPVTDNEPIINRVKVMQRNGCRVVNYGVCTVEQVKVLYRNSKYLVFPSLAESFGLPLIEATVSGCKVIASDLAFVKEVIAPSLVFDPLDKVSIFNALVDSKEYDLVKNSKVLVRNQIDQLLNFMKNV